MYRGTPVRPTSPPRTAMLADMNRLPSMPSRPAPLHTYASYDPYHHHRNRDSESAHAQQQLPSLRTLLEPELLDSKTSDSSLRSGFAQMAHGTPAPVHAPAPAPAPASASAPRYASASPTLKRRHDFDTHSPDKSDNNANPPRPAPVLRHAPYAVTTEPPSLPSFSTPISTPVLRQADYSHHGSFIRPPHNESAGDGFRQASATQNIPSMSEHMHSSRSGLVDERLDPNRPMRRRTEGTSRAPVRSSPCVGQREIPGEGMCYVYADGTYCRKVIDGEAVNPSWGITKAGKPRKRLAQACLTCREKKIKCEPGFPKCHQCAKSQRACRGGLGQQGMSNASGETSPSSSSVLFKNPSTELISPVAGPERIKSLDEQRESSRPYDAWNAANSFKPRPFATKSAGASVRDMSVHSIDSDWSGSLNQQDPDDLRRGSLQEQLALQWEQDPYEADSRLTMHLLDLYFCHAGRATYGMFPRGSFQTWVETCRDKNQDHLMLLYAVLAMGSIFSNDQEMRIVGKRFATVAAFAAEKRLGKFTLQLCQTRLLLALNCFARGKSHEAWDLCGAGLRAISALKLNTEDGVKEYPETTADLDYGFNRQTLEECCRRTFWSGFLMDRYNGFCGGTLCVINIEDTFLPLPCLESTFEASTPCDTPQFDYDLLSPQHSPPGPLLGHMAYLALISVIWGDVLTFTSRAIHRPVSGYERLYETFYAQTYSRLDAWHAMLPANLQYSPQNLDQSIVEGYAGTFLSLHALYTTAVIRLNRHVRVNAFSNDKIARNIDQAFRTASHFLSIMHSLAAPNRQRRLPPNTAVEFLFSTPFPGYALMLSVDVLAAAGTVSTLPNLIETLGPSLSCVDELAIFWASARAQHKAIAGRIKQLSDVLAKEEQGVTNGGVGGYWKIPNSLETAFGAEDVIYKVDERILYEVIGRLTSR